MHEEQTTRKPSGPQSGNRQPSAKQTEYKQRRCPASTPSVDLAVPRLGGPYTTRKQYTAPPLSIEQGLMHHFRGQRRVQSKTHLLDTPPVKLSQDRRVAPLERRRQQPPARCRPPHSPAALATSIPYRLRPGPPEASQRRRAPIGGIGGRPSPAPPPDNVAGALGGGDEPANLDVVSALDAVAGAAALASLSASMALAHLAAAAAVGVGLVQLGQSVEKLVAARQVLGKCNARKTKRQETGKAWFSPEAPTTPRSVAAVAYARLTRRMAGKQQLKERKRDALLPGQRRTVETCHRQKNILN